MSRVRTSATAPELAVRKMLWSNGVRYRLNDRRLPGKPDIHVPRLRTAIFVHGCFWHGHNCSRGTLPKTNAEFWEKKIRGNRERDATTLERLKNAGIRCVVIWACELSAREVRQLRNLIKRYKAITTKSQ
jgi:DNA mismatch endonuclease (patch repair protein)